MRRKLPVLILALIILLQAFVPAVYAASENEAISSNIYLCPFDTTSEGAGKAIKTPYGDAFQSTSKEALQLRKYVDDGGELYRGGTFGRSNVTDAQFWAPENPLNPGYAEKYGVDFSKTDYIIGGRQMQGGHYITRPAPGLGNNAGGGLEIVNNPNSVRLDFFYMP